MLLHLTSPEEGQNSKNDFQWLCITFEKSSETLNQATLSRQQSVMVQAS